MNILFIAERNHQIVAVLGDVDPLTRDFPHDQRFAPAGEIPALGLRSNVNDGVANGVVYAGAATSGTTLLQVGPLAADVVLNVMATGKVSVETSVAGLSAAV